MAKYIIVVCHRLILLSDGAGILLSCFQEVGVNNCHSISYRFQ